MQLIEFIRKIKVRNFLGKASIKKIYDFAYLPTKGGGSNPLCPLLKPSHRYFCVFYSLGC